MAARGFVLYDRDVRQTASSDHGCAPLRLTHDDIQPGGASLPGRVRHGGHIQCRRRDRRPRDERHRPRFGEENIVQGRNAARVSHLRICVTSGASCSTRRRSGFGARRCISWTTTSPVRWPGSRPMPTSSPTNAASPHSATSTPTRSRCRSNSSSEPSATPNRPTRNSADSVPLAFPSSTPAGTLLWTHGCAM